MVEKIQDKYKCNLAVDKVEYENGVFLEKNRDERTLTLSLDKVDPKEDAKEDAKKEEKKDPLKDADEKFEKELKAYTAQAKDLTVKWYHYKKEEVKEDAKKEDAKKEDGKKEESKKEAKVEEIPLKWEESKKVRL